MGELVGTSGVLMCGTSIIFIILGIAYPYWLAHVNGTADLKGGLWIYCNQTSTEEKCPSVLPALTSHEDRTKLRALRGMMILGLLFCTAALVFHLHYLYLIWDQILGYIAAGLTIVAALLLDVGIVIFITRVALEDIEYHAGFFFTAFSMLTTKITAVLLIKRSKMGSGAIAFKKWT